MLKRKEKDSTVTNITTKWVYHLVGHCILFWCEKHFLEINNFKGCSRAVESDLMGSYQAVIIGSVILSFKQILTLDGWIVMLMTFMMLRNY